MVAGAKVIRRRHIVTSALAMPFVARAQSSGRVVVIGGGFGGATAARFLHRYDPALTVTLLEPNRGYTACPFSNLVIAGGREMEAQQFDHHIAVVQDAAAAIDPAARTVRTAGGATMPYDRLILAPGIDFVWNGLPGYDEAAAAVFPHAWKAGEQTIRLRRQLEAMHDGGIVVMSVPPNPYRCPPGPYERASLIAWYLKARKPRSKIIVFDSKDTFSKQKLFQSAWKEFYPAHLEFVPLSEGGKVTRVDASAKIFETEFGVHHADVGTVVPPQRAGAIAIQAGVADRSGWCPIDPATFESRLVPAIHVIGDAAIAGAMPKSAFAANAQGKVCAAAVAALLRGEKPDDPRLINTCYSLVAPDFGISVAGVYRPVNGVLADIDGAGGTSPLDAPPSFREQEARYAERWFQTITEETFG